MREHHRNKVVVAMREGALMYTAHGREVSKRRRRSIRNTGDGSDPREPPRIKAVPLNHLVCHAIRAPATIADRERRTRKPSREPMNILKNIGCS